jgi:hypothetical protein
VGNLIFFVLNALFVVIDVKMHLGIGCLILNSFAAGFCGFATMDEIARSK